MRRPPKKDDRSSNVTFIPDRAHIACRSQPADATAHDRDVTLGTRPESAESGLIDLALATPAATNRTAFSVAPFGSDLLHQLTCSRILTCS